MSDGHDVDTALTYQGSTDAKDYETQKIEFTTGRNTKVKLQLPVYEDQEKFEILLKLLREFQAAIDRYDLWTKGSDTVYDFFQQCLRGDARDAWETSVTDEDEASWNTNVADFVENTIGEDAHEDQIDYLKGTKKPHHMAVKKWFLRLKTIKTYLPFLVNGGQGDALDEAELCKLVVSKISRVVGGPSSGWQVDMRCKVYLIRK